MYWSASIFSWFSSSSSERPASISMLLVITADPATATAAVLTPVRALATTRANAWPTPSSSVMFFSTTALGGSGSTA
ncbi:hypothetical protein D3C80_1501590 [compost metagenome]